jgi:hypothetical protein
MLTKFVQDKKEHWDDYIDTCVFAYNTSVQESSNFTPFEIMFGRKATLPIDIDMEKQNVHEKLQKCNEAWDKSSNDSCIEKLTEYRQKIITEAKDNIKRAQEKQKIVYDRKHSHPEMFKVGNKVLKKDFRRKKRANGKLDPKYLGPYKITKELGKGFYALELVANPSQIVKSVSGAHLKPYAAPASPQQHTSSNNETFSVHKSNIYHQSSSPSPLSCTVEHSIPPLPPPLPQLSMHVKV